MFRIPWWVARKALQISARHVNAWPEDDWFCLGEDYDLNLSTEFRDSVMICHACVYKVNTFGFTLTDDWVQIVEFVPKEGQHDLPFIYSRLGSEKEEQDEPDSSMH